MRRFRTRLALLAPLAALFTTLVLPASVFAAHEDNCIAAFQSGHYNVIVVQTAGVTTNGTDGDDLIFGTAGSDTINGGGGNDVICGRGGSDILSGDNGIDQVIGDVCSRLGATAGADTCESITGSPTGDPGNDTVSGGNGSDNLALGGGVWGDGANDSVSGGNGDDSVFGGAGIDRCDGGRGTDTEPTNTCESETRIP